MISIQAPSRYRYFNKHAHNETFRHNNWKVFLFLYMHRSHLTTNLLATLLVILTYTSRCMSQSVLSYYQNNQTPTYAEVMDYYRYADSISPYMHLQEGGLTDAGIPLHVLVIDGDQQFTAASARSRNKMILLINNGIHPGEPDGVDACLQLVDRLLHAENPETMLADLLICIIPMYNIDGALNRNSTTRVNQNGPEAYGFRGNARNYDLNRDFIKADSRNAIAFAGIYTQFYPDVFIDTHVSNGADYQHVITLIPTLSAKLSPHQQVYMDEYMLPELYAKMQTKGYPMCPYVNTIEETPDDGLLAFHDRPRYSTGYAALFNAIGFMPETHMLKPYPQRVASTLAFIESVMETMVKQKTYITQTREIADKYQMEKRDMYLDYTPDMKEHSTFEFMGYVAAYKPSDVSGLPRLYYDRNQPYTKEIPYYNKYKPTTSVRIPEAYIVPQAWVEIIEKLKANRVHMEQLTADTLITATTYYITKFETGDYPYEGHYFHNQVEVRFEYAPVLCHKGDYIIKTKQSAVQYLVTALEPQSPDGFFAWGFFDAILMQKEWYSEYVFEDLAAELIKNDPRLREQLEAAKSADPTLANSASLQLQFIYEHSKYKEPTHKRYPVLRIE